MFRENAYIHFYLFISPYFISYVGFFSTNFASIECKAAVVEEWTKIINDINTIKTSIAQRMVNNVCIMFFVDWNVQESYDFDVNMRQQFQNKIGFECFFSFSLSLLKNGKTQWRKETFFFRNLNSLSDFAKLILSLFRRCF